MSVTTVPVSALVDPAIEVAVTAYVASKPNARIIILKGLNVRVRAAMMANDNVEAFRLMDIVAAINAAPVTKAPAVKAPVNYVLIVAQRAADLYAAADALMNGSATPEGIDPVDLVALKSAYNDVTGNARLASAKITRSVAGHSIVDAIERAFEGTAPGTVLTTTEISNASTIPAYTDEDGVDHVAYVPSTGAIEMSLKSTSVKAAGFASVPVGGKVTAASGRRA